jgi:hypothetical protein
VEGVGSQRDTNTITSEGIWGGTTRAERDAVSHLPVDERIEQLEVGFPERLAERIEAFERNHPSEAHIAIAAVGALGPKSRSAPGRETSRSPISADELVTDEDHYEDDDQARDRHNRTDEGRYRPSGSAQLKRINEHDCGQSDAKPPRQAVSPRRR